MAKTPSIATIDGVKVALHNPPERPTILLAHGWGSSLDTERDFPGILTHRMLDSGYTVVRFDYPAKDVDSGLEAIDKVMPNLGEGDGIYLVGHSFGGLLTVLYDDTENVLSGRIALDPLLQTDEQIDQAAEVGMMYERMGVSREEFLSAKGRDPYGELSRRKDLKVVLSDETRWSPSDHYAVLERVENVTKVTGSSHNFVALEYKVQDSVEDYINEREAS